MSSTSQHMVVAAPDGDGERPEIPALLQRLPLFLDVKADVGRHTGRGSEHAALFQGGGLFRAVLECRDEGPKGGGSAGEGDEDTRRCGVSCSLASCSCVSIVSRGSSLLVLQFCLSLPLCSSQTKCGLPHSSLSDRFGCRKNQAGGDHLWAGEH